MKISKWNVTAYAWSNAYFIWWLTNLIGRLLDSMRHFNGISKTVFYRDRMQNCRLFDCFFVSAIRFRVMSVNDRTMVFNTKSAIHKQNDVRFNCENNGFWLGVFDCNGHHAVTGSIKLFYYQVKINECRIKIVIHKNWTI